MGHASGDAQSPIGRYNRILGRVIAHAVLSNAEFSVCVPRTLCQTNDFRQVRRHLMTSPATIPFREQAQWLEALATLNRVAADINRASSVHGSGLTATLRLIAEGAVEVAAHYSPDSAVAAVIYTCDATGEAFVPASRVAAGEVGYSVQDAEDAAVDDAPRPDGLGARALRQRKRVLSYETPGLELHEAMRAVGARVGLCYPLIVAGQPVGALYVYLHQDRRFSELELLLLDNFVNLAALAIHRDQELARTADYAQRVQRDLERKEDELARMRRADLLISSRSRLQDTLESILQMALEVTDARYGILRLVDDAGSRLVTRALAGDDLGHPAVEALPLNATSIIGWVAKTRTPLCIVDVHADPWARIYYPLDHEHEMRSELAVPLIGASGRLEGVINLESPLVGAFSEDDNLLLQSLATQAVIAIQEVRLLDALQEIAERLLTQPLQQVLDRLVELACELLGVPVSALWTLEDEHLVLQSANAGHVHGERVALHGSLTGQALLQRAIVVSEDVRLDPRFQWRDLARQQGWTQALVAPLLAGSENEAVGALGVYNTEANASQFSASDWDKKVLTFLAHHAALAVRNATHQEALLLEREQRAAAETFAAVGDIAANLLHRLNNKIGVIPVRVEGIQDKCQASLAADPYLALNLAEIERSAAEAMEALSDSLFYLRPIRPAPVDLASAVTQALSSIAVPGWLRVQVSDLDALPTVIAGQQRLSLVFVNLFENAITALENTGEGAGEIRIHGAVRGGWVEITVSDSGPGIPPALHDKIFEFNYSGAKRDHGKFGFGLWWVRTLMARFGGTVTVESEGRGASFLLRFPIEQASP